MSEDNQKTVFPCLLMRQQQPGKLPDACWRRRMPTRGRVLTTVFSGILLTVLLIILGGIPNLCKYDSVMQFHGSSHVALHVPSGIYVPAVSHDEKREEGEKCPPVWDVLLIALAIGAFATCCLIIPGLPSRAVI